MTPADIIITAYDAINAEADRAQLTAAYATFIGADAPPAIYSGACQIIPRRAADGRRHRRAALEAAYFATSAAAADVTHDELWSPVAKAVMMAARRIAYD